jgi:chromosome segregation ATPase
MGMFSKELLKLDKNTVDIMIEELREESRRLSQELVKKDQELAELDRAIAEKKRAIAEKDRIIAELVQRFLNNCTKSLVCFLDCTGQKSSA